MRRRNLVAAWVWPSIAAALAFVALSESVALAVRPGSRVIVVQQPATAPESRPAHPEPVQILSQSVPSRSEGNELWSAGGSEALAMRRQVLRFGVEGLPDPPSLASQSDGSVPRFTQPVASLRIRQGDEAWRALVMRPFVWSLAFAASLLPWAARGRMKPSLPADRDHDPAGREPGSRTQVQPAARSQRNSFPATRRSSTIARSSISSIDGFLAHVQDLRLKKSPKEVMAEQEAQNHWLTQPLATLPRDAVRKYLEDHAFSLHEIELGARREFCDWEFQRRDEGIQT